MKTRATSLVLAATLSLTAYLPLSAAPSTQPATYRVSAVETFTARSIQPGDTMMTVLRLLSVPHTKLSRDTWIYRSFQPGWAEAKADGCDTLVITFAGGRVSDLLIVNQDATNVLAAKLQSHAAPVHLAKN